jgi:prepilin-type processing-associated H-X9-DG protein
MQRSAFTLIEAIVVVAMISLLSAITVCAIQRSRAIAARSGCGLNLRQIALAVHAYSDAHGQLPEGCAHPFSPRDKPKYAGISWLTLILPYVEQDALWAEAWAANTEYPPGDNEAHYNVQKQAVPVFMCPLESRRPGGYNNGIFFGLTSYQGVAGTRVTWNDGVFHRNFRVKIADISDGTSNTLMIGERPPGVLGKLGAWYAGWGYSVCQLSQILPAGAVPPRGTVYRSTECDRNQQPLGPGVFESDCDLNHFWSIHTGGANFALADGSVRFLPYSAASMLPLLATRAGGETASPPD